jgi:subtilisin family serine protease
MSFIHTKIKIRGRQKMKAKIIAILIMALLILSALPSVTSINDESRNNLLSKVKAKLEKSYVYAEDEFFVKFKVETNLEISKRSNTMITGIQSIDDLNKEFKVIDIKETFLSRIKNPKNPELFTSIGLDRIYTFKVEQGVNILDAVEAFDKDLSVEYAEVNGIGFAASQVFPNDADFGLQWGLHNTGSNPPPHPGKSDADIDAPEAWDLEKGDSSVTIAIIDKGIDWTHNDLSANIWLNPGEDAWSNPNDPSTGNGIDDDLNGFTDDWKGWNFIIDNGNSQDQSSDSHGTHCAGIAGAVTNNNIGIAGVSWNSKLMAVRAMHNTGTIYWSDGGPAIIYAADNGADIISMSFGGTGSNSTLKAAVDYAYSSGCVLVAAMGNQAGPVTHIPAAYSNTIAVGATDNDDTRAKPGDWSNPNEGSNYGNHIDVIAPGSWIYSTLNNNQYGYKNGTSMATPMVAGLAALLLSRKPSLTNVQVRDLIRQYAEDEVGDSEDTPGFDKYYGYGRINADKSLRNKILSLDYNVQQKNIGQILISLFEQLQNLFPILKTYLQQI